MGPLLGVLARIATSRAAVGVGRAAAGVAGKAGKAAAGAGRASVSAIKKAGKGAASAAVSKTPGGGLSSKIFDFSEERSKRGLPDISTNQQQNINQQQQGVQKEVQSSNTQTMVQKISSNGSVDGDNVLEAILHKLTSIESITSNILQVIAQGQQARSVSEEKSAIKKASASAFMPTGMMPQVSETSKNNMLLTALAAVGPFLIAEAIELVKNITESIGAVKEKYNGIIDSISMFINDSIDTGKAMYDSVVTAIKDVGKWFVKQYDDAKLAASKLFDTIVKKFTDIGKRIANLPIVKKIVEGFQGLFDWLDKMIPDSVKKAFGWTKEKVSSGASAAAEKVSGTAKKAIDAARESPTLMNVFDQLGGGASYDPNSPVITSKSEKVSIPSSLEELIAKEEGKVLQQYPDVGGKATIGYGHLITSNERKQGFLQIGNEQVPLTQGLTEEQANQLRKQDIDEHQNRAIKGVGEDVWKQLPENAKNALVSYTYNVGKPPDDFAAAFKSGGLEAAAETISKGTATVNKTLHKGLYARRQREAELMMTPSQKVNDLANSSRSMDQSPQVVNNTNIQAPAQAPNMSSASKSGEGSQSFIPSPDAGFDPTLNVLKSSPMFMLG